MKNLLKLGLCSLITLPGLATGQDVSPREQLNQAQAATSKATSITPDIPGKQTVATSADISMSITRFRDGVPVNPYEGEFEAKDFDILEDGLPRKIDHLSFKYEPQQTVLLIEERRIFPLNCSSKIESSDAMRAYYSNKSWTGLLVEGAVLVGEEIDRGALTAFGGVNGDDCYTHQEQETPKEPASERFQKQILSDFGSGDGIFRAAERLYEDRFPYNPGFLNLSDSLEQLLSNLKKSTTRKSLIVITSGFYPMEKNPAQEKDLIDKAHMANATVYILNIRPQIEDPHGIWRAPQLNEEQLKHFRAANHLLYGLADRTGGRAFMIHNDKDFRRSFMLISWMEHNRYHLAYTSDNPTQKENHAVKIRLKSGKKDLYHLYYSPVIPDEEGS